MQSDPVVRGSGEWPRYVVGAPEQVRDELSRMAESLKVEEIMIIAIMHDYAARQRSYRLVAEALGIPSRFSSSHSEIAQ